MFASNSDIERINRRLKGIEKRLTRQECTHEVFVDTVGSFTHWVVCKKCEMIVGSYETRPEALRHVLRVKKEETTAIEEALSREEAK